MRGEDSMGLWDPSRDEEMRRRLNVVRARFPPCTASRTPRHFLFDAPLDLLAPPPRICHPSFYPRPTLSLPDLVSFMASEKYHQANYCSGIRVPEILPNALLIRYVWCGGSGKNR